MTRRRPGSRDTFTITTALSIVAAAEIGKTLHDGTLPGIIGT